MPVVASRVTGLILLGLVLYSTGDLLHPVAVAHPWAALACLSIVAVVLTWPKLSAVRTRLASVIFGSSPLSFGLALGAVGASVFALVSQRVLDGTPRLDDSVAALFSARVFLSGHVTLPMPPDAEFFKIFGVLSASDGVARLAGMYPPGWPALLAVGQAFGAPWMVNPLCGGALAVVVTELGSELYDRRTGRVAGILVVLSPLLGVLSASHLSHLPTALFCCLAWWATLRVQRTGRPGFAAIAGVSLGMAFLNRPATTAVVGAVIGLGALSRPRRLVETWRSHALIVVLVAAAVLGLFVYQAVTTGDPFTPGHRVQMGEKGGLGFVAISRGVEHTLARGLELTRARLEILDRDLLGFPVAGIAPVLLLFLLGRGGWRELWLLAPCAGLLALFAAFWYQPTFFPGRYMTAGLPPLLILVAAGWRAASSGAETPVWARTGSDVLLVFCLAFALLFSGPVYRSAFEGNYGDVETVLPRVVERYGLEEALVLITARGRASGPGDQRNDYYASGFRLNELDLGGDVVYARSLGDDDVRLIDHHPDRKPYLYVFDRRFERAWLYEIEREDRELVYRPVPPQEDLLLYDGRVHRSEVSSPAAGSSDTPTRSASAEPPPESER